MNRTLVNIYLTHRKLNWSIVEGVINPEIWEKFSEQDRDNFFKEAENEEREDSKANAIAQITWLGR